MKKILVMLISAILLVGCANAQPTETKPTKKVSEKPTLVSDVDYTLKGIDGKRYKLTDFRGKKVYIKFWASWCHVCLGGLDHFNELSKSNQDFVVLSVVAPEVNYEANQADFTNWFKQKKYDSRFIVLFDEGGKMLHDLGVNAYPTSIFVNANQEIVRFFPGDLNNETIIKYVKMI